jgi:ATP-dependent DNA helicase DinG
MRGFLGPDGPVAARFAGFEERASQVEMAEACDRAFELGGRLMVEAGTGTGKTFAYLLPALLHAALPDHRVVISTWTKNLQEQLVEKDLPLLRALLGVDFEAALVQGRENYVCRRRAEESLRRPELLFEDPTLASQLRRLVEWSATSDVGTRGSLPFVPKPEAWAAVRAERGNCLQARSPFHGTCVWQQAKRRAREAPLLVVNHALLLADLKLKRAGGSVLPPYSALVVDEAHHLEEVAVEHLGGRVSRAALFAFLKSAGRTATLVETDARGGLEIALQRCRGATVELFERAHRWLDEKSAAALTGGVAALSRGLPPLLRELEERLREAAAEAESESIQSELLARGATAVEMSGQVDVALAGGTEEELAWAERLPGGDVALCTAPTAPGPILARELFAPLRTAILTSATLAVSPPPDRFSWLERGTGLQGAETLRLASPFDYRKQAKLVIDPLPNPGDSAAWTEALVERVPEHVRRTEGRAFVLFTSRATMEAVAAGARAAIEEAGIRLLVQGQGLPRTTLLAEFRNEQPAVLFGLASFWEGVDVPGRDLAHVILTRLPFPVPDHPLEKARAERARKAGLDPFRALSLPAAVLRFKQGFGRLIRRKDDTGIVTVLDPRIVEKRYGRAFLDALPDCPKVVLRDGEEIPLEPELDEEAS